MANRRATLNTLDHLWSNTSTEISGSSYPERSTGLDLLTLLTTYSARQGFAFPPQLGYLPEGVS